MDRFSSSCSALHHRAKAATVASADLCLRLAAPSGTTSLTARQQTSRGKTRDFLPIYPPHLRPLGPDGHGLQVSLPLRPPGVRLVCDSCSSGRGFAYGFLPTSPCGDAVAVPLGVPTIRASGGLPPPSHFPVGFRLPVACAAGRGARCHVRRTKGLTVGSEVKLTERPWVSRRT